MGYSVFFYICKLRIIEIMDFIYEYQIAGLIIGVVTFLIIGLFHPLVIKCEYHFGTSCWWWFLILGIMGIIASLWVNDVVVASAFGVFAFSSFWTIKEIFEQRKRVLRGWFPKNPNRLFDYDKR